MRVTRGMKEKLGEGINELWQPTQQTEDRPEKFRSKSA